MQDGRNVIDEFKNMAHEDIVAHLDERGVILEIAIENLTRDFNMGTIVRSANAFGVRNVHIIGRHGWNKRGAMATDKYLHVNYFDSVEVFAQEMTKRHKTIVAVDNVVGARNLQQSPLPRDCVLVFGAEGPGLTSELISVAHEVIAIEQFGSTRSINVGVAAGIVMYEWLRQHSLR